MHYKKGEPIGHVDDIGQEILCGDVIFDGAGRRYVINEKGQAETEGGGIFDVKKLKEVVISRPTKEGGQTPPHRAWPEERVRPCPTQEPAANPQETHNGVGGAVCHTRGRHHDPQLEERLAVHRRA